MRWHRASSDRYHRPNLECPPGEAGPANWESMELWQPYQSIRLADCNMGMRATNSNVGVV